MKSSNEVLTKMESVIRGDNETEMNASCTGSYCLSEASKTHHHYDPTPLIILGIVVGLCVVVGGILCLVKNRGQRKKVIKRQLEKDNLEDLTVDERLNEIDQLENELVDESSDVIHFVTSNPDFKSYEVKDGHWDLGEVLLQHGRYGEYGPLYEGTIVRQDGKVKTAVAVKTLKLCSRFSESQSFNELQIMAYLGKHPCLVSLVGVCVSGNIFMIATEFCANRDLCSFLRKNSAWFCLEGNSSSSATSCDSDYANIEDLNRNSFSLVDLNLWAYEIAEGMEFLASKKVIHCELAARNVLLTDQRQVKICDFKSSFALGDSNYYEVTKKVRTRPYPMPWSLMAPESLRYLIFSLKSDVWSYGVILYEIFSLGEKPWVSEGWTTDFIEELEKGRRLAKPQFASQEMYERIMLKSWSIDPQTRPSFTQMKLYFQSSWSSS